MASCFICLSRSDCTKVELGSVLVPQLVNIQWSWQLSKPVWFYNTMLSLIESSFLGVSMIMLGLVSMAISFRCTSEGRLHVLWLTRSNSLDLLINSYSNFLSRLSLSNSLLPITCSIFTFSAIAQYMGSSLWLSSHFSLIRSHYMAWAFKPGLVSRLIYSGLNGDRHPVVVMLLWVADFHANFRCLTFMSRSQVLFI